MSVGSIIRQAPRGAGDIEPGLYRPIRKRMPDARMRVIDTALTVPYTSVAAISA